ARAVGRVKFVNTELGAMRVAGQVDQDIPEDTVDQPRRAVAFAWIRHLAESNLESVNAVDAGLVDARRLTGRPDENPREHVRQRRMVEPIAEHAAQQIGTAQKRTVGGHRGAERNMVAAAGTGMPPVQHEFLGAEPALARFFVERGRIRDQLGPVARGMDVDLDYAG